MKRLVLALCLCPVLAHAQPISITIPVVSAPLVRLSKGDGCADYPRDFASGTAKIHYSVDADGKVSTADITSSSGTPRLDRAAVDCARSWKFLPLKQTGATAPFQADATATYSDGRYRYDKRIDWITPQMNEVADMSASDLTEKALACLRGTPGVVDAAAQATFFTGLYVQFTEGEVSKIQMRKSSGSNLLDDAAVHCFQAVPPDAARAYYLKKTPMVNIDLAWRELHARLRHETTFVR